MKQLNNTASVIATYDQAQFNNSTTLAVELAALDIRKTADKKIWVKDELEYTITLTNLDEDDPGLPCSDITVTDKIDTVVVTLDQNSVYFETQKLEPGTDFNYNATTGELEILPAAIGTIPAGESRDITFQVNLVQP